MYYEGAHSVIFGDKHSWEDWFLIPASRPTIAPPPFKDNHLDLPGMNGKLDISEILIGKPLYDNRTGSFDFFVDQRPDWTWEIAKETILNYIHGKRMKVILTDELEYYYTGRLTINALRSDKAYSSITINYNFEPFKKRVHGPNPEGENLI